MDKNSPFNKEQDAKVLAFPGRQWREERQRILKSNDPIDLAVAEGHPRELHREVDMRIDAKGADALSEDVGRKSTFDKVMDTLGLGDPKNE